MLDLSKFKTWLLANGYAESTIINYICRLKTIKDILNLEELTEDNVIQFIAKLRETAKSETINAYLNAIASYCKCINIELRLPQYKIVEKTIPDSISLEFLEKELIPAVDEIFNNTEKVKTILYFMFYSGLRRSEIVELKRKNFNFKECTIKIYKKKQKKEMIVLFPSRVKTMLIDYFNSEEEESNAFNIGYAGVRYIFKRLSEYFPDKHLRPHLFKHSCATHLLKKGVDLAFVKEHLGHANIQTTMKYIDTSLEVRKEVYDKKIK